MREWFTPQELAGLAGMPGTPRGVRVFADRANWEGRKRVGTKAIEYSLISLPAETQAVLLADSVTVSARADKPEIHPLLVVAPDGKHAQKLNESQRAVMLARLAFCREIERMAEITSQNSAINTLVALAQSGSLSPYLQKRVEVANDRASVGRALSERTLKRWLSVWRASGRNEVSLAPLRRRANFDVSDWVPVFLRCYQRPTKPSVAASYLEFCRSWTGVPPSIQAVQRFLKKLSPEALNHGRMSPQELKALQAFNRRETKNLLPGDVYTADGHKFDAEVLNPITGKPYRPEITTVLDVATRKVVGVSVGESESAFGVLDALREAVRECMFAILYVDNGTGFDNHTVREVVDRLGGTMMHALPYNSQAKGLSERSHLTMWVRAAKRLPSYIGADMDKQAGTRIHRIGRKELRETGKTRLMPTFGEFLSGMEAEISEYNRTPHRGLPKFTDPNTGLVRHLSPDEAWQMALAEGWEPIVAHQDVINSLMRPQITRTTNRGEIAWAGQRYYLSDLTAFHGEEIRMAYDVRDASHVWAYTMEGELIGAAALDGNVSDYMPRSVLEIARDKRIKGQYKRTVDKIETLTGNKVDLVAPTTAPSANLPASALEAALEYAKDMQMQQEVFEIPGNDVERYRLWKELNERQAMGVALSTEEARWWKGYSTHPDLIFQRELMEGFEKNAG